LLSDVTEEYGRIWKEQGQGAGHIQKEGSTSLTPPPPHTIEAKAADHGTQYRQGIGEGAPKNDPPGGEERDS